MIAIRVALFWVGYIGLLVATSMLKPMVPAPLAQLLWGAVSATAILLLTLLFVRREGKTLAWVGARPSVSGVGRVALGMAIGFAMYAFHLLVISLFGGPLGLSRNPATGYDALLLAVATFLATAAMEGLGFRGYTLRTLTTGFGPTPALLVTAIAFGLSHLLFGWSWTLLLVGVIPVGLLLGAAALASGGLAVPIGLHAAWNISSWCMSDKREPGLWTANVAAALQGRVQMVGSVSYGVTMLAGAALFWWWYRRRSVVSQ